LCLLDRRGDPTNAAPRAKPRPDPDGPDGQPRGGRHLAPAIAGPDGHPLADSIAKANVARIDLISLPDTFEAFLAEYDSKKRYNFKRQLRVARESARGDLVLERIEHLDQVPGFLDDIAALGGGPGPDPSMGETYPDLAHQGLPLGYVLKVGGRSIACAMGKEFGDTLLVDWTRDNRDFRDLSPGTTLLHLAIEDLIGQQRFSTIHLGHGSSKCEFRSTNTSAPFIGFWLIRETWATRPLIRLRDLIRRGAAACRSKAEDVRKPAGPPKGKADTTCWSRAGHSPCPDSDGRLSRRLHAWNRAMTRTSRKAPSMSEPTNPAHGPHPFPRNRPLSLCRVVLAIAAWGLAPGCGSNDRTVVVYSSLDPEFSGPVLDAYTKKTGVDVLPKFDVESTKSVGLTERIIQEAPRPRCDLFWNNEILNTIRLKRRGLLAPWSPANGADIPDGFKGKDGTWYGFAARARVLIVNTDLVIEADRPKSILDLVDPRWKGKVAIAKPLAGTTATHATCLFLAWGDEKAKAYFSDLKRNGVHVLSGNKQVATAVGAGEVAVGLTDTDDAIAEVEAGRPVAIIYPDREPGQLGTLFIPNTLSIPKGAPSPKLAEALGNVLLSPETEATLAKGPSAQIPLNRKTVAGVRVEIPRTVQAMVVDFEAAATLWDRVAAYLASEFATGS